MQSKAIQRKNGNTRSAVAKSRKHVLLDQPRLTQAQELLGAKTESETIELALERVISEAQANQAAWTAHTGFVTNLIDDNIEIVDVFGRLER